MRTLTAADVERALATVMDPEIPAVSIVDLGVVARVAIDGDVIEVDLLPTFAGCPALDVIREDVEAVVRRLGCEPRVRFVLEPAWTTDRVTEAGRAAMTGYGIAPPVLGIGRRVEVACPYCGSLQTIVEAAFGPTPCRDIRYCSSCRNPFEGFKQKR